MLEGNYHLAHANVHCVNENCGYLGDLKDFIVEESAEEVFDYDIDDFDFGDEDVVEVQCVCPECGKKFKAEITRHYDYYVDEIKEE